MSPHGTDASPETPRSSDSVQAFPRSNPRWFSLFPRLDALSSRKYLARTYVEQHGHEKGVWDCSTKILSSKRGFKDATILPKILLQMQNIDSTNLYFEHQKSQITGKILLSKN